MVACVPVAGGIRRIFRQTIWTQGILHYGAAVTIGGFLFAAPFAVSGILGNRSIEQYFFADDEVALLASAIEDFGGEGRVLFSGFVLHDLSGGHLAPLTFQTSKQMVASSHVHDKWWYQQVIPVEFMKRGDAGIYDFLDLYNVSAVVAHEPKWKDYFRSRPQDFELAWQGKTFSVFRRLHFVSKFFAEGSGRILGVETNQVRFSLETPSAIMKFHYFPFLKVEGCRISPYDITDEIQFIRLDGCPTGTALTLRSVGPLTRLVHHE